MTFGNHQLPRRIIKSLIASNAVNVWLITAPVRRLRHCASEYCRPHLNQGVLICTFYMGRCWSRPVLLYIRDCSLIKNCSDSQNNFLENKHYLSTQDG